MCDDLVDCSGFGSACNWSVARMNRFIVARRLIRFCVAIVNGLRPRRRTRCPIAPCRRPCPSRKERGTRSGNMAGGGMHGWSAKCGREWSACRSSIENLENSNNSVLSGECFPSPFPSTTSSSFNMDCIGFVNKLVRIFLGLEKSFAKVVSARLLRVL